MQEILTIRDLSVIYEEGVGIKDINLDFYPGDFVALVGSNGVGKSTLLNSIAGIQATTKGIIDFNDNFIRKDHPYSILGFSPQSQVIDWYLNVLDNVMLGPLLTGENIKNAKDLSIKALSRVSLEQKKYSSMEELSGGQQQRVQIARAIAHQPSFFLLDEPTTGLDAETSNDFLEFLKE